MKSAEPDDVANARRLLESNGYVVLKATSYRRAQERQHLADARREWAEEQAEHARQWALDCLQDERRITERLTFVWGVARARDATSEELAADPITRPARSL